MGKGGSLVVKELGYQVLLQSCTNLSCHLAILMCDNEITQN